MAQNHLMIRQTLDWKAACLFVRNDPEWRQKIFVGGLWLIVCPPLGWLMALGYRKEVVMNLVHGRQPLLPTWKGQHWFFFREGVKAVGVILTYFMPFFVGLWWFGLESGVSLADHLPAFGIFFALIIVLAPICLPAVPIWYVERYDWFSLTPTEMFLLAVLFVTTTYIIPAGFMQVSRSGRFRDALRLFAVYDVLRHHLRGYTEAWVCSGCMTVAALASGPLAPFGIIWSYQGIVYCFNEVLLASPDPSIRARLEQSHFSAISAHGVPSAPETLKTRLGLEYGRPQTCVVNAEPWAVESLSVTGEGVEILLRGPAGRLHQMMLESVWRPHLSATGRMVSHFFTVTRRGDILELDHAGAVLVLGLIHVPLPKCITPRFKPQSQVKGAA